MAEAFFLQNGNSDVLVASDCGSSVEWASIDVLIQRKPILALRHGPDRDNSILLLAGESRAVAVTREGEILIHTRHRDKSPFIGSWEIFSIENMVSLDEHFDEIFILKDWKKRRLFDGHNLTRMPISEQPWLGILDERLNYARNACSRATGIYEQQVDFDWPGFSDPLLGQEKVNTHSTKRVCIVTSGLPRYFQSSLYLLSRQLGFDQLAATDFLGVFWNHVGRGQNNYYPLKDLCDSYNAIHVEPMQFCDPCRGTEMIGDPLMHWTGEIISSSARKAPETNLNNMLAMFYMRGKLLAEMERMCYFDKNRYDAFIFIRTDTFLEEHLDWGDLFHLLERYDIILSELPRFKRGFNDQVCVATEAGIRAFLSVYPSISAYANKGILIHPEGMLRHHLEEAGVSIGFLDSLNTFIVRGDSGFKVSFQVGRNRKVRSRSV